MVTDTDWARVTLFAHRGFAGVVPENTLVAARSAGALGADAIECDVVATADGTPVVFHDRRLDDHGSSRGITDSSGPVDEHSTETVTNTTVLDTPHRIPTLSAFVEAVPSDVSLNIELKHPGTRRENDCAPGRESEREQWFPFIERVLDTVERGPEELLFSSFSQTALAVVQSVSSQHRVAPIAWDIETATTMADALDAETVHPAIEGLSTAADRLDDYTVNVWTARTWEDVRHAIQYDIDGLIADYPSLLSPVMESQFERME